MVVFPIGLIDVLRDSVDWPSKACGQLTVKLYEGGSTMKRNVMLLIVGLTLAVLLAGSGWASSTAATEEIQVTGTVLENSDGQKVIKINDYKVIKE